jgi:hypothetical protein
MGLTGSLNDVTKMKNPYRFWEQEIVPSLKPNMRNKANSLKQILTDINHQVVRLRHNCSLYFKAVKRRETPAIGSRYQATISEDMTADISVCVCVCV